MEAGTRPLELILARNLAAALATPAFLIDGSGAIAFYNEAAGVLLGRRFEESGALPAVEWTATYGPFAPDGSPMAFDEPTLTRSLLRGHAAGDRLSIRSLDGAVHAIEMSGVPIVAADGYCGAMIVFWPSEGVTG